MRNIIFSFKRVNVKTLAFTKKFIYVKVYFIYMLYKNKKAQVVIDMFLFIFASFSYFAFGYEILNSIITATIQSYGYTGLMFYLIKSVPFLPMAGLVFWGYKLAQGEPLIIQNEGSGGFQQ